MESNSQTPAQDETIFSESDYSMKGYDKHIRNTRIMLFIIAGMQILPLLTLGRLAPDAKIFVIIVSVLGGLIFAGLAIWTKYKPLTAILVAFGFYVALLILNIILGGIATLFQGVIVKAIVIVLFILGLQNARQIDSVKKSFGK